MSTAKTYGRSQVQTAADREIFSRYPAKLTYRGKPVPPKLDSPDKRMFRTRIREGVNQGVAFADHYSVASWGCGAGCTSFAIIDGITGRVYMFPATVSQANEAGVRLTFERDSRAMHIIGSLNEQNSADRWYVWDGAKLNLLSEKPAVLLDDSGNPISR
jgi:hypothetical protein